MYKNVIFKFTVFTNKKQTVVVAVIEKLLGCTKYSKLEFKETDFVTLKYNQDL